MTSDADARDEADKDTVDETSDQAAESSKSSDQAAESSESSGRDTDESSDQAADSDETELGFAPVDDSDEADDQFYGFLTALAERDVDLEGLEPPASVEEIAAAEDRLGLTFPSTFRAFLLRWNGGSAHEICIYGVGTGDEFDIVDFNERSHAEDLPHRLVGFASTIIGDVFCFDLDESTTEGEYPVALYDAESGDASEVSTTYRGWLGRLHTLEAELADAQQPQPMSIEEWESFLVRERAKLRRLSKTPARELVMPDPDVIRAELDGKIPVDPRHLKPRADGGASL